MCVLVVGFFGLFVYLGFFEEVTVLFNNPTDINIWLKTAKMTLLKASIS